MADRFVNVFVTAKDLTGNVFNRLRSDVEGFEQGVNSSSGAITGMSGQVEAAGRNGTGSMFMANLQALALEKAIESLRFALDAVTNTFEDALDRQLQKTGAVITNVKTLGLSYQEAANYAQAGASAIAEIGASTPATSENISEIFLSIQDDYNLALANSFNDLKKLQDVQINAATQISLLAETSNSSIRDTKSAIVAYLAGSVGPRGLNQYKFFGNNPVLKTTLVDLLQTDKPGSKSFADVDLKQRIDYLNEALNKSLSKEDIDLLAKTTKSILSNFLDKLFDPEIGLFSIQRDLNPNIEGYQSVFNTFGETVNLLIGEQGIFAQLARVLGLGDFDPMVGLNEALKSFNQYITNFRDSLLDLESIDLFTLGKFIGEGLADVTAMILNFIGDNLYEIIGGTISFISGVLYGAIKRSVINFVEEFFRELIYNPIIFVGSAIANLFDFFVIKPITYTLGFLKDNFQKYFADPIAKFFEWIGERIEQLQQFIPGSIKKSGTTAVSAIPLSGVGLAAKALGIGRKDRALDDSPKNGGNFFTNAIDSVKNFFGFGYSGFIPAATGFVPTGLIDAIATEGKNKPFSSDFLIANTSEYVLTKESMKNLVSNVSNSSTKQVNVSLQKGAVSMAVTSNNPQEIAMQVANILENLIVNELQARLT